MNDGQQYDVVFRGHVQGVGFRYTTVNVARNFEVTGYVRNLPSGEVHLVAEGSPAELDRFVLSVKEAMAGFIEDSRIDVKDYSGGFAEFSVRR